MFYLSPDSIKPGDTIAMWNNDRAGDCRVIEVRKSQRPGFMASWNIKVEWIDQNTRNAIMQHTDYMRWCERLIWWYFVAPEVTDTSDLLIPVSAILSDTDWLG